MKHIYTALLATMLSDVFASTPKVNKLFDNKDDDIMNKIDKYLPFSNPEN